MSVTALDTNHTPTKAHEVVKSAAIRTEEDRRVKQAANLDTKTTEPVRPSTDTAAKSASAVQSVVVGLKKGG